MPRTTVSRPAGTFAPSVRLVMNERTVKRPIGVVDGIDYHHTGEVRRIDRKGINRQLDERSIVLLSPLGYSPTGEIFNLACEDVAMRAAIDLGADKLILYGAERGLLDSNDKLVRELRPQQVPAHLERLGASYQGELLDAAAQACRDDYVCAQVAQPSGPLFASDSGGACMPPYFLFQMRVDGHP